MNKAAEKLLGFFSDFYLHIPWKLFLFIKTQVLLKVIRLYKTTIRLFVENIFFLLLLRIKEFTKFTDEVNARWLVQEYDWNHCQVIYLKTWLWSTQVLLSTTQRQVLLLSTTQSNYKSYTKQQYVIL